MTSASRSGRQDASQDALEPGMGHFVVGGLQWYGLRDSVLGDHRIYLGYGATMEW